jgi:uncharacterized protein (UPF0210 family)
MSTTYKVLGQLAASATTYENLYTVPDATQTVVSTIVVANRGIGISSFRIAVRPAGATLSNQHFISYDTTIGSLDSTAITLGITLNSTDIITVYAANANLSFSAFGSEIS